MKTSILLHQTSNMTKLFIAAILLLATLGLSTINPIKVHAAGCTAPTTDYGTVSLSVNIPAAGTYRIWSRMAAPSPSSVNNNYLLQIDGTVACYTVGGTTVPVYTSGATTYFSSDSSNWIAKTTAGAFIDVNFTTTGSHALKLIGNADGVVVDRVILTQDTTCTPTGMGDNCYTPPADTVKPTVSVSSPAASATVSGTITAVATASDDVGVVKVEGYINSTLFHTEDTAPYTFPLDTTTVPDGDQLLTFRAYDAAGNVGVASIHVTVQNGTTTQTPPVVSISSPAQNATISSTTTVTAVATDNTAVTKVEFFVDGTLKGTDTTVGTGNTFTYSLNPVGLSIGSHTLTAKAYDAQPSSTTSSVVTFTVPSSIYNIADINTDGTVNFLDFSALSSKYNQSGSGLGRTDMNSDGSVNFLDFSILASNYGKVGP